MKVITSTFLLVALSLSGSSVLANPQPFFGLSALPSLGLSVAGNLLNASGALAGNLIHAGEAAAGDAIKTGGALAGNLVNASTNLAGNLVHAGGELAGNLVNTSSNLAGNLAHTGGELAGNLLNTSVNLAGNLLNTTGTLVGNLLNTSSSLIGDAIDAKLELDESILNATSALGLDLANLGLQLAEGLHDAASEALQNFTSNLASVIAGLNNSSSNSSDSSTKKILNSALQVLKNVSSAAVQLESQLINATLKLEAAKLRFAKQIQTTIVDWIEAQVERVANATQGNGTEAAGKIRDEILNRYGSLIHNAVEEFVIRLALLEQSVEKTVSIYNNATLNLVLEIQNILANGTSNTTALSTALRILQEAPLELLALKEQSVGLLALGLKAGLRVTATIAEFEAAKIAILAKLNNIIAESLGNLLNAGASLNVTSELGLGLQIAEGIHDAAADALLNLGSNITSAIVGLRDSLRNATDQATKKALAKALVVLKNVGSAALQLETQLINATKQIEAAKLRYARQIQQQIVDWLENQVSRVENATQGNGTEAAEELRDKILDRYANLIHNAVENFVVRLAVFEQSVNQTISYYNNATQSLVLEIQNSLASGSSNSTAISSALQVLREAPVKILALKQQIVGLLAAGLEAGLNVTATITQFNGEKVSIIAQLNLIIGGQVNE